MAGIEVMDQTEAIIQARAFFAVLVREQARVELLMNQIATPLFARYKLGQAPSPNAFAKVAAAWRSQIPTTGRLSLTAHASKNSLNILEHRLAPGNFRYAGWDESELTFCLFRNTIVITSERYQSTLREVTAAVCLHAISRRLQRGFGKTVAALKDDLALLAGAEVGEDAIEFGVSVPGGRWMGVRTVATRDDAELILPMVRTFLNDRVHARPSMLAA